MIKERLILVNQNKELQRQLTLLYSKTWLDEKYKYVHQPYFGGLVFDPNDCGREEQYAVMRDDNIIGYIVVSVTTLLHTASISLAINFTDDTMAMGSAFHKLIRKLFSRNFNKISWGAVDGNPIIKSYQNIAETYGGRQESHERYSAKLWDGTVADTFAWGILKEEYERNMKGQ